MLSLGTGDPPTEKVDSVDLKLPDGILGIVSAVSGASAMGRLLVDQAASATNRVVDRWSIHLYGSIRITIFTHINMITFIGLEPGVRWQASPMFDFVLSLPVI